MSKTNTQTRIVTLENDINWKQSDTLCQKLLTLDSQSNDSITLIINSSGGGLYSALQLCDLIEHFIASPVQGVVLNECSSAATFVLLSCSERWCTPHARFLIHSGTASTSFKVDDTSEENLERLLSECRKERRMVIDLYSRKLNISHEKVEELMVRGDREFDQYLFAQEAKDLSLVNKILTGKIRDLSI